MEKIEMQIERGINLTNYHQLNWLTNARKKLLQAVIFCFFLAISMLFINFYITEIESEIKLLQEEITKQQTERNILIEKVEKLKNKNNVDDKNLLDSKEVSKLIQVIKNIPTKNGGITHLKIYSEQKIKSKVIGSFTNRQEFEILENYLNEKGFKIEIEHLQTKEKTKIDFSIILEEKED